VTALLLALAQDAAAGPPDLWSQLLGFDRLRIEADAEWSINFHHMPPAWVLFLVILPAVLLLVGGLYRAERKDVGRLPKIVLTTLRSLAIILVLLLLMGPVLTVETIKARNNFLIVLLDESRSMQKNDPLRTEQEREAVARVTGVQGDDLRRLTRADMVRKVLENPQLKILEDLERKLNLACFTFSSVAASKESAKKMLEDYGPATCVGTETAIGDAIKQALASLRGQYVAGVLVFTDGRNNAGIATQEIAAQLKQRYLPVYAVAAGLPRPPRNIGLTELEARDAVLANDEMKVSFKVTHKGYENEQISVGAWLYALKEEDKGLEAPEPKDLDRLIAQANKVGDPAVTLKPGVDQKQAEAFTFNPKQPGEYLLILRADPRAEENTANDNYLTHRLRVADDKIKVLFVEHPPRFEFRFLKSALIRDPKILVHTFQTSADEGFTQDHTKADDPLFREPLKEFPRDLESLLKFDVVIFGDTDPARLGPDAAKHLETFVSEFGGGVVFISGTLYNPRSLVNTPLANLLPVVPEDGRDPYEHEKVYDQILGYHLTPDGRTHPITNFKEFKGQPDRNQEHWEDRDGRRDGMVGIRGFTRVKKLKAGASPLVELTGVPGETGRVPLFATQYVGRGRVFWSATDETWLWRRLAGDYPWFYPFWQQAMYWVREGKLLGARRFRINVDKERYTRGDRVKIFASAYDEKFEGRTDATLDVFIDPPAGTAGLERVKVTLHKDKSRETEGYYEGEYTPAGTGLYRAWAGEEDEATRAVAKFVVFIPDREDDDPVLDEKTLRDLSKDSYGGEYFAIDQVDRLTQVIQKSQNQLRETKEDDLWDAPLAFLVFAALLTAEWILRKIYRML
jgi:hypothetical protein